MKYRKKPVIIDAVRWTGANLNECQAFLGEDYIRFMRQPPTPTGTPHTLFIATLEGEMEAPVGHWLIQGVKGEHYSCDPDVFAATYEPAEETIS